MLVKLKLDLFLSLRILLGGVLAISRIVTPALNYDLFRSMLPLPVKDKSLVC